MVAQVCNLCRPGQCHRLETWATHRPVRTPVLAAKPKVLWVSQEDPPANVRRAVGGRWRLSACRPRESLRAQLDASPLAVVHTNGHDDGTRLLGKVLIELERSSAVAVFLLPPPRKAPAAWRLLSGRKGQFLCAPQTIAPKDLAAHLAAAEQLQPAIGALREELLAARTARDGPAAAEADLTQELHLAARLQRDFLPRRLPEVGPVRFSVLYRPLGWVSGDVYDVTRLDETHLGFYVADAVGHGLPAALLTMFIKKALQTKRILGHSYEIVPPEVSLAELNRDICQQSIASCPFCTAIYCVLDTKRLVLSYARAGHPEAVLTHADGRAEQLAARGTLLGIFPEETYESREVTLAPGDRLVLFTDGAESALGGGKGHPADLPALAAQWSQRPREDLLLHLSELIENPPAGRIDDDVTIVLLDVMK